MIALGTHPPMSDEAIHRRLEITAEERAGKYRRVRLLNHAWNDPAALAHIGTIPASEIGELSGGLFEMDVDVAINRAVFDYDQLVIVGPVFPHEVVGFSGGNKYLFPGIGGPEILNFFHWLGAVITNPKIIGNKWTPVRRVVDRAAALVPVPKLRLLHGRARGRPGRPVRRDAGSGLVAGRRPERQAAHHLQGPSVSYRSVVRPADVRRNLGRRQVHVQAGAGRGRRRRTDHLRPAHPRDFA